MNRPVDWELPLLLYPQIFGNVADQSFHIKKYMRWIPSSVVMGVHSLFGSAGGNAVRAQNAMEDIREAMLSGLNSPASSENSKLELKVTYANDLHDLWYLRGDVMAAISAVDGEVRAQQKINDISAMFKGVLPKSLTTRPRRTLP